MNYLKINQWEKWQTFRSDRGSPPWIKIHRQIMTNPKWAKLTDSEKGQLICLWIIAADKKGTIPDNEVILKKIAGLDKPPNINKFIDLGFIIRTDVSVRRQHDVNVAPSWRQHDVTDKIRGEKRREELRSKEDNFIHRFNEFWETFANKINRAECEQLYRKIIKTTPHEEIIEGVKRYNKHLASDEFSWKNKLNPKKWLKKEGWKDEYSEKQFDPANPYA